MRFTTLVISVAAAVAGCTVQSSTEAARAPHPVPITDPIVAVYEAGGIRIEFAIENAGEGRLTWIAVTAELFLSRSVPKRSLLGPAPVVPARHPFKPPLRKGDRAAVDVSMAASELAVFLQDPGHHLADVLMDLCISHNNSQGAHLDGTIVPLPVCAGSIRLVTPEEYRRLPHYERPERTADPAGASGSPNGI